VWLVAAALFVGIAAMNVTSLTGGSSSYGPERAAKLRDQAREACAKAAWRTCLDRLDEADGFDPKGSRDADMRALREKAEAALRR
jgi:hypothetical protein